MLCLEQQQHLQAWENATFESLQGCQATGSTLELLSHSGFFLRTVAGMRKIHPRNSLHSNFHFERSVTSRCLQFLTDKIYLRCERLSFEIWNTWEVLLWMLLRNIKHKKHNISLFYSLWGTHLALIRTYSWFVFREPHMVCQGWHPCQLCKGKCPTHCAITLAPHNFAFMM